MTAADRSYHHGDLRNALITAAAEIIAQRNSLSFTVADVARAAGVSSAAPYRHFADKEAMLSAVRDLALLGLDAAMKHAAESEPAGSVAQVTALGCAYLNYAQEKRAFFSLMWESMDDMAQRRADAAVKATGFRVLTGALDQCVDKGLLPASTDTTRIGTHLWSMVHGVSTLALNQMLDVFDDTVTGEQVIFDATQMLFRGLRHSSDSLLPESRDEQIPLTFR